MCRLSSPEFPDSLAGVHKECFSLSKSFTAWDLLFVLDAWNGLEDKAVVKEPKDIPWCDVESLMRDSLEGRSGTVVCWELVFHLLRRESIRDASFFDSLMTMAIQMDKTATFAIPSPSDYSPFYQYLFSRLRCFEQRFGRYILVQEKTQFYRAHSEALIQELVQNHIFLVDSFNYTSPSLYSKRIRNLHGCVDAQGHDPVFGVTFTSPKGEEPKQGLGPLYYLTKAYQTAISPSDCTIDRYNSINEIIFYGSSLSEQDYYYYFRLFDNLKLSEFVRIQRLTFAYSNHSKEAGVDRQKRYDDAVRLITAYDAEKKLGGHLLTDLEFYGILHYREIIMDF